MTPVRSYDELVEVVHARIIELELTYEAVDDLAGLQRGYTAKLVGPARSKHFGEMSFDSIVGALALSFTPGVDEEAAKRVGKRWQKRKLAPALLNRLSLEARARIATGLKPRQIRTELATNMGRKGGKRGGRARAESLSPKRRSAIARMGGKARWRRVRERQNTARCAPQMGVAE